MFLRSGKGEITVNGRTFENYFPSEASRAIVRQPLLATETADKFDILINTDGGGLCNNHPSNRGGLTKVVEAVRQLRGEAHPKVQVPNCDLALAHGTGGSLGTRHGAATVIMERE